MRTVIIAVAASSVCALALFAVLYTRSRPAPSNVGATPPSPTPTNPPARRTLSEMYYNCGIWVIH
jgi:hypothetical protein